MNNGAILAADPSRLAALLVAYIVPLCALLAPCHNAQTLTPLFISGSLPTGVTG